MEQEAEEHSVQITPELYLMTSLGDECFRSVWILLGKEVLDGGPVHILNNSTRAHTVILVFCFVF